MKYEIRSATKLDALEILEIYGPYVANTAVSFEYDVPSVSEFEQRIINITKNYPYLVAMDQGKIVGYAYASKFKERKAYRYSAETTIYLLPEYKGKGIGRLLYTKLEEELKEMGIKNMYACIVVTDKKDQHVSNASWHFHEHMGFKLVGRFHKCGYIFDKWYDIIYMEKHI